MTNTEGLFFDIVNTPGLPATYVKGYVDALLDVYLLLQYQARTPLPYFSDGG